MTFFCVDVETDGPAPGLYSMLSIGVVAVRPTLDDTFYVEMQPLDDAGSLPEALAISGLELGELKANATPPQDAMASLAEWVETTSKGRPAFISDNPAFDFSFVNWYFHRFEIKNPFGWSARRIGDLYACLLYTS